MWGCRKQFSKRNGTYESNKKKKNISYFGPMVLGRLQFKSSMLKTLKNKIKRERPF